jgi:uncharacterized membrane protein HdeD (DUF308 family)
MPTAAAAVSEPTFPSQRVLAFRGALLLLFGLVEGALLLFAFHLPHVTTSVLVLILAGFVLADGLATLFEAVAAMNRGGRWIGPGANTVAGIAACVIVLFVTHHPLRTFASWVLVTGVLEAWTALWPCRASRARTAAATVSVTVGILVLVGPFHDNARLILAMAVYGLITGALRLQAALRATAH